jgi:dienelactone hydrolase
MPRRPLPWRRLLLALVLLAAFGAIAKLLYEWDPTRVLWKRWTADSPYLYEEVHPRFLKTDPASLIRLANAENADAARTRLVAAIWGDAGLPLDRLPQDAAPIQPDARQAALRGIATIERLTLPLPAGFSGTIDRLRPVRPNGRVVLFQNGHGGTGSYLDHGDPIGRLLLAGYTVLALNLPTGQPEVTIPGIGPYRLHPWRALDLVDNPLRLHFTPVIAAVNQAVEDGAATVDMIGFSAGGWITMVAAAVDPRIRRSYPVSGGYPLYLRSGEERNQSPRPQYYRPLILAANYLEMFVLASHGPARRQRQVFNRYDRCCYNNIKGRLYAPAVRDAAVALGNAADAFAVWIDETHPRHKISDWAMDRILEDLARP